ncbi:MAG: hypothetical protein IH926_05060 [Proteobacteria bacterium]|nr:hypothetical protein [Pseudomonadota bacterium]
MSTKISPIPLIVALCAAEIASMPGVAAFPALLPTFIGEWQLTNTDAGWINGIYFAGYLAVGFGEYEGGKHVVGHGGASHSRS